jgi:hypothetical protein
VSKCFVHGRPPFWLEFLHVRQPPVSINGLVSPSDKRLPWPAHGAAPSAGRSAPTAGASRPGPLAAAARSPSRAP